MIPIQLGGAGEGRQQQGGLKKGPWSAGEDKILVEYVRENGEGNWNAVQRNTPLERCGKSCRLRWANHLRPNLKKGSFSHHEERLIIDLHSKLGNKWARISAHLPGRTDNEVKNYWNTRVKRRLRQGLPLYPHNHLTPPSHSPPPPTSPPPPPLPISLSHLKTPSFFDPTSLPFPPPFFSFNHPFFVSTLGQCIHPSSLPFGSNSRLIETEPPDPLCLGFESMLELPSNQMCTKLASGDDNVYDYEANDEAKFNLNMGERSDNSGLLDALLQEAQSKAAARNLKKDSLDGDQMDFIYGNSLSGLAKMEEPDKHTYCTNEDLSSILNLVTAPKWKDGREASSVQASIISDDINAGPDSPHFPHVSSSNYNEWLNSSGTYTSWDNLPRIW